MRMISRFGASGYSLKRPLFLSLGYLACATYAFLSLVPSQSPAVPSLDLALAARGEGPNSSSGGGDRGRAGGRDQGSNRRTGGYSRGAARPPPGGYSDETRPEWSKKPSAERPKQPRQQEQKGRFFSSREFLEDNVDLDSLMDESDEPQQGTAKRPMRGERSKEPPRETAPGRSREARERAKEVSLFEYDELVLS